MASWLPLTLQTSMAPSVVTVGLVPAISPSATHLGQTASPTTTSHPTHQFSPTPRPLLDLRLHPTRHISLALPPGLVTIKSCIYGNSPCDPCSQYFGYQYVVLLLHPNNMSVDKHIVICKHVKGNFLIWFSTSDELSMFAQNMGAVSVHAVQGAWKAGSGRGGE